MAVNANVRTNPDSRLQTSAARADVRSFRNSKAIRAALATAVLGVPDRRLLQAVDEERVRIGRELHDDIGQQVALLGLRLEQLNNQMTRAPKDVRALLTSLISQASGVGATVQRISRRLHPPTLQYLGLSRAIRTFCAEVSASQAIQVECIQEDGPADPPFDIALNLFRIVQEAVANVVKHSRAERCTVISRGDATGLHLDIIDNGCGFDPMETQGEHGLGLISMRERCGLLKATITVESESGHGTCVRVRLPLRRARGNVRHEIARKVLRETHNMTLARESLSDFEQHSRCGNTHEPRAIE